MNEYIKFWKKIIGCVLVGNKNYYMWLGVLITFASTGVAAYVYQLYHGLQVTNMTDQVSWGAYIANFTFLVGVAAAAVLLVVPSYIFHRADIKKVVLIAELLALSAITMCLLFVTVDIGRPDRFFHLIPFVGKLNIPGSILSWDVVVINVYLLLNLHIPGYLLYRMYKNKPPSKNYYIPFVYVSIAWAVSIHTVTAFLYSGFGSRPFWNTAILAPRFLVSAFASGPALLIIVFWAINKMSDLKVEDSVFNYLKRIIRYTVPLNLFLLGCEIFKEFYTGAHHSISMKYLFFGVDGHYMITPYIWGALLFYAIAMTIFLSPKYRDNWNLTLMASAMIFAGIWVEKGMGLIIPGFFPTPLGEFVEYAPSLIEFFVSLGIWSIGAIIFTTAAKVAIAITVGKLRISETGT